MIKVREERLNATTFCQKLSILATWIKFFGEDWLNFDYKRPTSGDILPHVVRARPQTFELTYFALAIYYLRWETPTLQFYKR